MVVPPADLAPLAAALHCAAHPAVDEDAAVFGYQTSDFFG